MNRRLQKCARGRAVGCPPETGVQAGRARLGFGYATAAVLVLLAGAGGGTVSGADWPMWRYDAGRTAASPQPLSETLHRHWSRPLPPARPAWPHDRGARFDAFPEPIVMDGLIFAASSSDDSVTAWRVDSGEQQWRFFTDGPVRLAPAGWDGKLYVASDDGHLYCLEAGSGELLWRFRAAPTGRTVLGNGRLISLWPVRGAPVVIDGTVYFAAGVWPFEGIFVYAVDGRTGELVWSDEGSGSAAVQQPHGGDVLAGIAPQGYLAAVDDALLVPNGRACPAVFDRATGRFRYFRLAAVASGRGDGGFDTCGQGGFFFNSGLMFDLQTGGLVHRAGRRWNVASEQVLDAGLVYSRNGGTLTASDIRHLQSSEGTDRQGRPTTVWTEPATVWSVDLRPAMQLHLKAGPRLYLGREGAVAALKIPEPLLRDAADDLPYEGPATFDWTGELEGTPVRMLTASERLFVVTDDGRLHCFGGDFRPPEVPGSPRPAGSSSETAEQPDPDDRPVSLPSADGETAATWAAELIEQTGVREGYALVLGQDSASSETAVQLVRQSQLHVVLADADEQRVRRLRERMTADGLYGRRIVAVAADPWSFEFPPYLANLIVCRPPAARSLNDKQGTALVEQVYQALRPYGGVAAWTVPQEDVGLWFRWSAPLRSEGAELVHADHGFRLTRPGPPTDAADWTHEGANAANTFVSKDRAVKAPLGVLWFGGPLHSKSTPPPRIAGGRMFVLLRESLRALDIYTGRLLWETPLPGLGEEHDHAHLLLRGPDHPSWLRLHPELKEYPPDARPVGVSLVSLPEAVYVAYGPRCLRIDPESGRTVSEFRIPADPATDAGEQRWLDWGVLRIAGDRIVAAVDPQQPWYDKPPEQRSEIDPRPGYLQLFERGLFRGDWGGTSSGELVVLDRHSGRIVWRRRAGHGFRHNAMAVGVDRVFVIDRPDQDELDRLRRRGLAPEDGSRLMAFDLDTGRTVWSTTEDVFGTALSYSEEHGVLVQAHDRFVLGKDQITGYRAADGTVLWRRRGKYGGPLLLRDTTVITQALSTPPRHTGAALGLLTGEVQSRQHPFCDRSLPWTYDRQYGCGPVVGSEELLLFRSAAAGFYDLRTDEGTGNIGGFRAGCTPNLVAAGGVLNAPDMTLGCICNFHHQTSLALVHRPDVETWTHNRSVASLPLAGEPLRRIGINFGAAGGRRAESGTHWVEYPRQRASTPELPIEIDGESPRWFRRHSLRIGKGELPWVSASGVEGTVRITLKLVPPAPSRREGQAGPPRTATVRLHFAEPRDTATAGDRIFDVRLQGQAVLERFDIAACAGGPRRGLVREFPGIAVESDLTVELAFPAGDTPSPKPADSSQPPPRWPPVLSGLEVRLDP